MKWESKIFFKALQRHKDIFYIILIPNVDPGSLIIQNEIHKFIKIHSESVFLPSLSPREYYSLVRLSDCVIGNSSSGIIEVPSLNIHFERWREAKGRAKSKSVINCKFSLKDLNLKISLIKKINKRNFNDKNPYFKKIA